MGTKLGLGRQKNPDRAKEEFQEDGVRENTATQNDGGRSSSRNRPGGKEKRRRRRDGSDGGKGKGRLLAGVLLFAVAAAVGFLYFNSQSKAASAPAQTVRTARVQRRDITSTLSSSGTISPKDTYSITSMAEGKVVEADFEEGDQVTEGQILYRIDASAMESKLKSAGNSLERSQNNYDDAVKDYNEAVAKYGGGTYKSTRAGYIKTLHITPGDKVSANTQIADIYNDQVMKIKVPFLNLEAAQIPVGAGAILVLSDTQEPLIGTVTAVSSMDETLTGGRLVRYVTIEAANPGGLTKDMAASAVVGEFFSSADGTFTPTVDTVLAADLPSGVEVKALLVSEGDFVSVGTPIFQMSTDDAQKLLKNYKDSMDSAESSLEQAQSGLDTTQENYDNYTVTAPISGTVIQKNTKVGDKVQNGNGAASLALIYDMSSVTFDMNIDELDIGNVAVGQTVKVTADAFEGQTFMGKVTKVSLEGTSSNGVTYYPVTVTLDEPGNFLPGMNVDGEIVLDSAENAIAIPADALMRGSKVYVKDDSVKEAAGSIPAGFREVTVETGLINSDYVEITSGELNEGDEVYLSASSVDSGSTAMMMPGVSMDVPVGAPGGGGNPMGNSGRSSGGNGGGSGGGRKN